MLDRRMTIAATERNNVFGVVNSVATKKNAGTEDANAVLWHPERWLRVTSRSAKNRNCGSLPAAVLGLRPAWESSGVRRDDQCCHIENAQLVQFRA